MRRIPVMIGVTLSLVSFISTEAQQTLRRESRTGNDQERRLTHERGQDDSDRPFIIYPPTRSSDNWVTTPNGTRQAIDKGVEWQGKKYFLSLTWSLIAVDPENTEQAVWAESISAFWNRIGIEILRPDDGQATDVIALRSTDRPDFVEYRSLDDGRRLAGTIDSPPGDAVEIAAKWSGNKLRRDRPMLRVITSSEQWSAVHERLFNGIEDAPPADPGVDFEKYMVVVVASGKGTNCNGYGASAFRDQHRLVLRTHARTYQSGENPPPTWPYGVFVVPRDQFELVVLERNTQSYIGGPPIWKTWRRLAVN